MEDLGRLVQEANAALTGAGDIGQLEQIKAGFLGKTGSITALLKTLGSLPESERREAGARINQAKAQVEQILTDCRNRLRDARLQKQLAAQALDVTLPGRGYSRGGLHPVHRALQRLETIFHSIGFVTADGPEIETDWHNFTALNMPDNHPARSMHDTFYLEGRDDVVLRTHTSPVQVRAMHDHMARWGSAPDVPDLRLIAPGRVYRVDSDATHSPMFHQIEGMWIGHDVSFADLKGIFSLFLQSFFETDDLQVRFRPSFFPFTEPSAEVDMAFLSGPLKGRWLEIAGCGAVHPNVLEFGHFDAEKYSGFAFGMGLDRLTMLRYGVNDLRLFFDNDLRFLNQFR